MASERVYLPLTAGLLRRARLDGGFGDPPLRGHAVTPALTDELGATDQEESEYAAMTAAALASLTLLADDDPPRRMVAAVDVPVWEPAGDTEDPTAVLVATPVPWRRLGAVLVDGAEAAADVAEARAGATDALERCLDHDLGWFAVQEVDELLDDLALGSPPGRANID